MIISFTGFWNFLNICEGWINCHEVFERKLALLAAVQGAGLEELEEETFTKSCESCNSIQTTYSLRSQTKVFFSLVKQVPYWKQSKFCLNFYSYLRTFSYKN